MVGVAATATTTAKGLTVTLRSHSRGEVEIQRGQGEGATILMTSPGRNTPWAWCVTLWSGGGPATCTVAAVGTNITGFEWLASVPDIPQSVPGPSGALSWGGKMARTSGMQATVVVSEGPTTHTVFGEIFVGDPTRSWSTNQSFSAGGPGVLDNCAGGSVGGGVGLVADKDGCSIDNTRLVDDAYNQGWTAAAATGPNAGLWYVSNPTTKMNIRSQVNKKYRPDGWKNTVPAVPPISGACAAAYSPNAVPQMNNYGINTICDATTQFGAFYSYAWSHEAQHISLLQPVATNSAHDLYKEWGKLVETTEGALDAAAETRKDDILADVRAAALGNHNGNSQNWLFWYYTPFALPTVNQWTLSTVTTPH